MDKGRKQAVGVSFLPPGNSRGRWTKDEDDEEDWESQHPACGFAPLRVPNRPYSWSEVIHRAGDESIFPAFERERPRIVNNFAVSASSGYEFSSCSEKMNPTRLSNLAMRLE
jgi:hypothetical protein